MGEPARKLNDDDYAQKPVIRPDLGVIKGGEESTPPKTGHLKAAEESADTPSPTAAENREKGLTDNGNQFGGDSVHEGDKSKKRKLFGNMSGRQKAVAGGLIGLIVGGSIGIFNIVQGPLKHIHWAQLLAGFHFSRQDSFGDDRSGKFLLYMLMGKGAQGRLGVVSNHVADKFETRLNERAGLRSVYSPTTRRLIGYEIIDKTKARPFLEEMNREGIPRSSSMQGVDINGKPVNTTGDFVDLRDDKFRTRRSTTRIASKATGVNRLASTVGSRVLIKRGGVDFHPMKNVYRKKGDDYFEWRRKQKEASDNQIRTGSDSSGDTGTTSKREGIKTRLQSALRTLKGPFLVAAGVCGTRSFSQAIDAENYNNQLILTRMGMSAVTRGNQVMSMQDFNLDILGVHDEYFYDDEKKSSAFSAASVQYELGKEITGPDMDSDQKPGSKEKPKILQVADHFTIVAPICYLFDKGGEIASDTPVLGEILRLVEATTDGVFRLFGLESPKVYVEKLIRYFATGSVNLDAKGAERGNYENYGVRLAANDQFIANGGRELSDAEGQEAKELALYEDNLELAQASIYDKYFNPLYARSTSARLIREVPDTAPEFVAHIVNLPVKIGGIIASAFRGSSAMAATEYDYGFPLYGFSMAEQDDPAYGNPFENKDKLDALLTATYQREKDCENSLPPGVPPYPMCEKGYSSLAELNSGDSSYSLGDGDHNNSEGSDFEANGKQCFGMEISENGDLIYAEAPDFTKIPDACKTEKSEVFMRYRFYIADLVTGHSLACYEGLTESCNQIGMGNTPGNGTTNTSPGGTGGLGSLECPANIEAHPDQPGYYRMPEAPAGEYIVYAESSKRWGSRELICATHSVGLAYNNAMQGASRLRVGNLNTPPGQPSMSHRWGVGIDLSGAGTIQAGSHNKAWKGTYSKEATVTLGKLLVDTGMIKNIWWCPPAGDSSIQEISDYAQSKGTPINIKCIPGHEDHFHVDIKDEYRLQAYSP